MVRSPLKDITSLIYYSAVDFVHYMVFFANGNTV